MRVVTRIRGAKIVGDRKLGISLKRRGHRLSRSNTNQEKEPTLACLIREGVNEGGTMEFYSEPRKSVTQKKTSISSSLFHTHRDADAV